MTIYGIQLKADATLGDVIALLNATNLTTNLEKVAEALQQYSGIVITKVELPDQKAEAK